MNPVILPITAHRDQIVRTIKFYPVTIISAETGSGKTTQVPQYILDDAAQHTKHCRILVSQPRKIAAITIASQVANERGCDVGQEVGYQVGLDKKSSNDNNVETKVLFCTTGVVVQKLIQEKNMQNYTHVILDEVHEREIDMDLLLILVKEFLEKNSGGTKLILMSATLNAKTFVDYFTFPDIGATPGVIELKMQRDHKIQTFYLDHLKAEKLTRAEINYSRPGIDEEIYRLAKLIIVRHIQNVEKSILVFLPGIYEINTLHNILADTEELTDKCVITVLHSSLSVKDQNFVFMRSSKPKVILSTNIAETSVTISDVGCVIDFGLVKVVKRAEGCSMSTLTLEWAAIDSLDQRAGRTGRTCDGFVYRLIDKSFHRKLESTSTPEMQRCPLETTILRVKTFDQDTPPANLLQKALDPPNKSDIRKAVSILKELGGLLLDDKTLFDGMDGKLTYIGRVMAALPVEPRVAKFIVLGYLFMVLDEAIIIAAGLTTKSIFNTRHNRSLDSYERKLIWADGSGCDFNAILNAYKIWKIKNEQGDFVERDSHYRWCRDMHLEMKSLVEMRALIKEIHDRLSEFELQALSRDFAVSWEEEQKPLVIKIIVAGAFFPNFFISGESNEWLEQEKTKEAGGHNIYRTVTFRGMDNKLVGEVYEDQVKQQLIEAGVCRKPSEMKVTFQKLSTKMYVEFPNDEVDTSEDKEFKKRFENSTRNVRVMGKVKTEVYKALKLNQLGFKMKLNVMTPEKTQEYAERYGMIIREHILDYRRHKHTTTLPEFFVIPTCSTKSLTGRVVHVDHLGKFFIQPVTESDDVILEKIDEQLRERATEKYSDVEELDIHQIVAVEHKNVFKRAKILDLRASDQMVRCYLVDFGKVAPVSIKNVYKVTPNMEQIFDVPERCFEASLWQIAPSALNCPRGKWTSAAVEMFQSLVLNQIASVEICSVVGDIASVRLTIDDVCINDQLVSEGIAQESEEVFLRRLNNQQRKDTLHTIEPEEAFKERLNTIRVIPLPPPDLSRERDVKSLVLKGPTSPMEASIVYASLKTQSGKVIMDPQSVNSVICFDDPHNLYGRLIIAANVTKNHSGMVIHETSMMPNIPGLPVILGLMFAPKILLVRNRAKTAYDAALMGLGGYDDGRSFFPENDLILPVNHEIDEEDFHDINSIRYYISYTLTSQGNENPWPSDEIKSENMAHLKTLLNKVLSKKRHPVRFSYGESNVVWRVLDKEDVLEKEDQFHGRALYSFFDFPKLNPPSKEEIAIYKFNLKSLRDEILRGSDSKQEFNCMLCNRSFEDTYTLKIHYNSKMHIHRLKKLEEWENQSEE